MGRRFRFVGRTLTAPAAHVISVVLIVSALIFAWHPRFPLCLFQNNTPFGNLSSPTIVLLDKLAHNGRVLRFVGDNRMSDIGLLIRTARQSKGLSQVKLGKITGLSHTYIAKIELGRQRGSIHALTKLTEALDLPIELVRAEFGIDGIHPALKSVSPDDLQFRLLPAKIKALLLDLSPILQRHVPS